MDTIIENAYRNPAYGLRSEPSLYKYLKPKYPEITHSKIKAWLNNQEIYQTMKPRNNNYQSFIATGPLEQFQIDLIYMPEATEGKGLYKVNGELYPRKELQLINHSTLVKPMSKTKAQEKIISDERKIGKAINSKLLKEIVDNPTREQVIKDIGTKVISYKRGAAPKAKYIL